MSGLPEGKQKIVRLREGQEFPPGWYFSRLIATEEHPTGTGTATERVYVVLLNRESP